MTFSQTDFNFGAFKLLDIPSYIDPESGEEIFPKFEDLFTFAGVFADNYHQKAFSIRKCTISDFKYFSDSEGKNADNLLYFFENY